MAIPEFLYRLLRRLHLLPARPSHLKPGESVWLFDNTAFVNDQGAWAAEFSAAYFSANSGKNAATAVAQIVNALGWAKVPADSNPPGLSITRSQAEETIRRRVQPFLNIVLDDVLVEVDFGGQPIQLGPHAEGGFSVDTRVLPSGIGEDGSQRTSNAILPPGVNGKDCIAPMKTAFAGKDGWAIVSDIDDTIKQSFVRDRVKLLQHEFVLPSTPVPLMPDLYARLNRTFSTPAFFYLSASPYSLYPMLHHFLEENFPPGQCILRNMTWQELESFIMSLTVGTQEYKQDELGKLMQRWPQRKWVFIGDSTQKDPESYAWAYKQNPTNVKRIWIHVVKGVNLEAEKSLNSPERFETAFKGVPRGVWKLFEDPMVLEAEAARVAEEA